jgi:hypothetical protein
VALRKCRVLEHKEKKKPPSIGKDELDLKKEKGRSIGRLVASAMLLYSHPPISSHQTRTETIETKKSKHKGTGGVSCPTRKMHWRSRASK